MRCKNCDYPLWNIQARNCPECGSAFAPSEYEFVPNSIRFCCPHCDQMYYGIAANGHLDPTQFECVNCHQQISMDEMVLRPAAGVDGADTQHDRMPWFERNRIGPVKAWFQTIGYASTKPSNLINAVPRDQSAIGAWMFMFATNMTFQIVGTGIPMGFVLLGVWIIGQNVQGMGGLMTQVFWQSWWQLPLAIFLLAFVPIFWMWLTHLLLSAVGVQTEPMRRTAHCIYYSSPANALSALPCGDCTQLAGSIWWLVSAILMIKTAHRCTGGKASFAVITAAVLSWGVTIAAAIVLSFALIGMTFGIGQMKTLELSTTGPNTATMIASNLDLYAEEHDGRTPAHALELLIDPGIGTGAYAIVTPESSLMVEEMTLDQFAQLPPIEQRPIIDRLSAVQPESIIAHRVGDVVFTYHGIDVRTAEQKFWLMVIWPPGMTSAGGPGSRITICQGDGTTQQFKPSRFPAELKLQNQWRIEAGLPPLPDDLLDLAHDEAVAADE